MFWINLPKLQLQNNNSEWPCIIGFRPAMAHRSIAYKIASEKIDRKEMKWKLIHFLKWKLLRLKLTRASNCSKNSNNLKYYDLTTEF